MLPFTHAHAGTVPLPASPRARSRNFVFGGRLRFVSGVMLGLALAFTVPAPARAQTVTLQDIMGTWWGREDWLTEGKPGFAQLTLWPDSIWCFRNDTPTGGKNHGGARWRLSGDTLWLVDYTGNDTFYHQVIAAREQALLDGNMDTVGLVQLRALTKSDSAGWADPWSLIVYKIARQDRQLILQRLDNLSKKPELAPKAVYRRDNAPGAGKGWTRGYC